MIIKHFFNSTLVLFMPNFKHLKRKILNGFQLLCWMNKKEAVASNERKGHITLSNTKRTFLTSHCKITSFQFNLIS